MEKNILSATVKALRKEYGLTQEDLSVKSGVGMRFVRDLEQGKSTLRLDKINQVIQLFSYELVPMHEKGMRDEKGKLLKDAYCTLLDERIGRLDAKNI